MIYRWIRDLHLYLGLFVSPFVLLFASSVLFLNHTKVATDAWTSLEIVRDLKVPEGIETLRGPGAIAPAKAILAQIDVSGEVGFTRYVQATHHLVFPVSRPGLEAMVDVDLAGGSATVSRRYTSFWEALAYLHKMPGPHNVAIRGNWIGTRIWHWYADATIYLLLFISITGIYLWWAIKAERRLGAVVLTAGVLTFCGLVYAIVR
jgi:hypothetical protein